MSSGLGRLSECRDCASPMRFVRLDNGTAMPVNPTPNPAGNVAARLAGGRLVGFVISRDKQPGPLDSFRFMPHAATCEARKRPASTKPEPEPDTPLW